MANRWRERRAVTGSSANGTSPSEQSRLGARQSGSTEGARRSSARAPLRWPGWARALVSFGLAFHITAVLAGAWGVPPSSELERACADLFIPYFDLADLGYSYRFYTEPPPTPVVTATLRFGTERPDETVRLPARRLAGPPLRHQRQLALANALFRDVLEATERDGHGAGSSVARAYARHLCLSRPDCQSVTLHIEQHLIPERDAVLRERSTPGAAAYDLFDESLFSTPQWIGDYPCSAF